MKNFTVAILGCGTVGSGVAKILLDMKHALSERSSHSAKTTIELKKIVDLFPAKSAEKYHLPLSLFAGGGKDLTKEEASKYITEVINDIEIDLVVETIGGTGDYLQSVMIQALKAKKHLVTANKAMLAEKGEGIFAAAKENNVTLGYEASVCGAIPIIKTIRESFTGDDVQEISGIMNGTSNYILSKMELDGLDFQTALALAQKAGYAEADPTLDISGGDAGHKLAILMKLAFGADVRYDDLLKSGIQNIAKEDIDFANEMDCSVKLICHAKKSDGKIFAAVLPMMVHHDNFLSRVQGATNCVAVTNKYSGKHYLIGAGAGSLETASAIVGDIVFTARYGAAVENIPASSPKELVDSDFFEFPYNITFSTEDRPGITGVITSAIGDQHINIDTVSHNRHNMKNAVFSIVTMPCTLHQVKSAVTAIRTKAPGLLTEEPKVMPILY
jgi:homoserine dehydrogenase